MLFVCLTQDIVLFCREMLKTERKCGTMRFTVVINMRNPYALIAMAQVAQNAANPYEAFCEYIKYCVFSNVSSTMASSIENSPLRTRIKYSIVPAEPHACAISWHSVRI